MATLKEIYGRSKLKVGEVPSREQLAGFMWIVAGISGMVPVKTEWDDLPSEEQQAWRLLSKALLGCFEIKWTGLKEGK